MAGSPTHGPDEVFLLNLELHGAHGVTPEERRTPQEFRMDIRAIVETTKAAASDSPEDMVDYTRFRDIAREVFAGPPCFLIERLTDTIARRILEDGRITRVTVTVRKPHLFPDSVPGLTITRARV